MKKTFRVKGSQTVEIRAENEEEVRNIISTENPDVTIESIEEVKPSIYQ